MGKARKGKKDPREDASSDEDAAEVRECGEEEAGRGAKAPKQKPREAKKKDRRGDESEDVDAGDDASSVPKAKKGKAKERKKERGGEEDVDEACGEMEKLSVEQNGSREESKPPKKDKKKKQKKVSSDEESEVEATSSKFAAFAVESDEVDEEEEEEEVVAPSKQAKKKGKSKPAGKSAFELLAVEDVDVESSEGEEEESSEAAKPKAKKGRKAQKAVPSVVQGSVPDKEEEKGGKKSKRKKRRDEEEDEIERVLAELEAEPPAKKETKAKGSSAAPQKESKEDEAEAEDVGSKAKSAAQKRKEKRERQKAQKEQAQKAEQTEAEPAEAQQEENHQQEDAEDDDEDGKDKKGKKKKKGKAQQVATEEEKKDEKRKGPGKKALAAMQETLRKIKEEEDRKQKEEEEKQKQLEEMEQQRLEKIRLDQERKELKKQKEKEKRARLKQEGKLLTPKQKADRARAQATLEALKAQGIIVPGLRQEKVPRPGTGARPNRAKRKAEGKDEEKREEGEGEKKVEVQIVDGEVQRKEDSHNGAEEEEEEEVKESWDQSSGDEGDVKDTWDQDSSGEDETDTALEAAPQKTLVERSEPEKKAAEETEESEEESEDESEDDDKLKTDAQKKRERAMQRIQKRKEEAESKRSVDVLRAAVVCVLGHVDTGKTKILDKLRRTHVQDAEAGGITQQIGATNVPIDAIREHSKMVEDFHQDELKLPGLLIIDTPGHESFSNLRSRGSSLCDMAVLVVDIMHGLEPQTLESINLLKNKKTPFIVALNKIDRLYDWKSNSKMDIRDLLKNQSANTTMEFEQRTKEVIVQFAEQSLNAALFFENPDTRSYVSMVPTSAISGDGMGNLMALLVQLCQGMLAKRLMYSEELQATVLEVKALPGLGHTIDVILVNGRLRESDTIVVAGTDGPIVTQIRSLLMPQPMKELRVKNAYMEFKEVQAAQGAKIAARDLEKAIAGLNMLVATQPDEVEICKEEVARELRSALSAIKLQERGVYVQASTLGSLEALLEFLRTSKIPYSGIKIGPVVKKDVMKASIMLEHDSQYAVILAFDVKIERDAQELSESMGVRIFQADIIYHLFDRFMAYRDELKMKKRDEFKTIAVFPCKLRILPQFVFNSRDPIVCGVMIEAGVLKQGTPMCVPSKEFLEIGTVNSLEINHKTVEIARKGQEVCVKIDPVPGESPKMFGRHFDEQDLLISKISRESIDACKEYFRDDLQKTDWQLMVELKKLFQIM